MDDKIIKFLNDFLEKVDDIFGLYLDCTNGFDKIRREFELAQRNIEDDELKKLNIFYGVGNPNKKESWPPLYRCSQFDFKERNKKNGKNYFSIANLCVVLIFDYWEYYREKIAKELFIDSLKISSDIMGDIRYYRNSILKHKGICNTDMKKCKILKFFKNGEEINISREQFKEIIFFIKNQITNIKIDS